jgi:hypothetical protein
VATPLEESDQRRRRHALHGSARLRRRDDADGDLQAGHRPDDKASSWCKTASRRPSRACLKMCAPPGHHRQERAGPDHGGAPGLAQQPLRHRLPAQLRRAQREGPARAHPGVGQVQIFSAAATIRCACGSTPKRSRSAA